jgi:hypothetical protein
VNEWRNDQWSEALESLCSEDQSLWKTKNRVMRVHTSSPSLQVPGGLAISDSEKGEALAYSLEAQFQPVDDPSDPAFTEMVHVEKRAYKYDKASEPILTTPLRGPTGHQESQDWQVLGDERYPEQGPETSPEARDNLSYESI